MKTRPILFTLLLNGVLVSQPRLLGQETPRHTLPDDPMMAWAAVQEVHRALRAPDDWRTQEPSPEQVAEFQKQVRQTAVSFADKAREFIEEKELPWPQHFDGKGWENQFAVQYGIFSIPTMWLVDKHGNLRDTDVRSNLERRVTALLGE